MFSLAGIPLMSGFFAKLYIFLAAVKGGLCTLAVIGVLTSVVSAYYYMRIIKVMYFDAPRGAIRSAAGVVVVRGRGDRVVHRVLLLVPRTGGGRGAGGGGGVVPVGVCSSAPNGHGDTRMSLHSTTEVVGVTVPSAVMTLQAR